MSVVRLSCKRSTLYAPDREGRLVTRDYHGRARTGRLGEAHPSALPRRSHALRRYVDALCADAWTQPGSGAPVVAMVHGFLFDPFHTVDCQPWESDNPHRRLYNFEELDEDVRIREHAVSWPVDLGFAEDDGGRDGLVAAFGWHSSPGLATSILTRFQNHYSRAYGYAEESSWAFVQFLEALSQVEGMGREFGILCHSLGSRIVVRAIAKLLNVARREADEELRDRAAGLVRRIGRVVVLGGAEYVVEAQLMHKRLKKARVELDLAPDQGPRFYNIVARENDVLDKLGENFGPRTFGNTNVIGHNGLGAGPSERWIDIAIDSRRVKQYFLEQHGLAVSGDDPDQIWDHWYYYTWKPNMDLYRRILREPDGWDIADLKRDFLERDIPLDIRGGWLFGD